MGSEKSMKCGLRICSSKLKIPLQLTAVSNKQVADLWDTQNKTEAYMPLNATG